MREYFLAFGIQPKYRKVGLAFPISVRLSHRKRSYEGHQFGDNGQPWRSASLNDLNVDRQIDIGSGTNDKTPEIESGAHAHGPNGLAKSAPSLHPKPNESYPRLHFLNNAPEFLGINFPHFQIRGFKCRNERQSRCS
jgi:hypothetical protein